MRDELGVREIEGRLVLAFCFGDLFGVFFFGGVFFFSPLLCCCPQKWLLTPNAECVFPGASLGEVPTPWCHYHSRDFARVLKASRRQEEDKLGCEF